MKCVADDSGSTSTRQRSFLGYSEAMPTTAASAGWPIETGVLASERLRPHWLFGFQNSEKNFKDLLCQL
jgi:hypothetical protein